MKSIILALCLLGLLSGCATMHMGFKVPGVKVSVGDYDRDDDDDDDDD